MSNIHRSKEVPDTGKPTIIQLLNDTCVYKKQADEDDRRRKRGERGIYLNQDKGCYRCHGKNDACPAYTAAPDPVLLPNDISKTAVGLKQWNEHLFRALSKKQYRVAALRLKQVKYYIRVLESWFDFISDTVGHNQ